MSRFHAFRRDAIATSCHAAWGAFIHPPRWPWRPHHGTVVTYGSAPSWWDTQSRGAGVPLKNGDRPWLYVPADDRAGTVSRGLAGIWPHWLRALRPTHEETRPDQGLEQRMLWHLEPTLVLEVRPVLRRDRLEGVLREHVRRAA